MEKSFFVIENKIKLKERKKMIKILHSMNKSYVQTACQEAKEKQNQMKKYFLIGNKMELKYIKHTYQPFFQVQEA